MVYNQYRGDRVTIKEVSEQFGLTKDTLRYYEKIGLIGPIGKTSRGIRDFKEQDLKRIEFVKCMRSAGISIDVLIHYMQLFDSEDNTLEERRDLLINQRRILKKRIEDMTKALKRLDGKINMYDQQVLDQFLESGEK